MKSLRASRRSAVAALTLVVAAASMTLPALASDHLSPAPPTVRGDGSAARVCTIPPPPPGSHRAGKSTADGIKHYKYTNKANSPLAVSLYYLNVLPKHGYRVVGYGMGGGATTGSGFNITAVCKLPGAQQAKTPKFLALAGGADKGKSTHMQVCSGNTSAVWAACSNNSAIPPQALPFIPTQAT